MVNLVSQLTLNLFRVEHFAFQDFIEGQNGEIVAALERWLDSVEPVSFFLWGGDGTGKTHLLQAAVRQINRSGARAIYLPLKDVGEDFHSVTEGLEAMDLVALDDVEVFYGVDTEKHLFDFYNRTRDEGGKLLLSSHVKPGGVNIVLRDLASRLNAGLAYKLRELDEVQKTQFLIDAAEHRGLKLEYTVVEFIMRTFKRDMHSLSVVLNLLDSASLQYGRALTIPFVREILNSMESDA